MFYLSKATNILSDKRFSDIKRLSDMRTCRIYARGNILLQNGRYMTQNDVNAFRQKVFATRI